LREEHNRRTGVEAGEGAGPPEERRSSKSSDLKEFDDVRRRVQLDICGHYAHPPAFRHIAGRRVGDNRAVSSTTDIIRRRAETVVAAVRGDEVGVYRMIKQLVATTIKEYRGRFLHELIQNGFDAHPEGSRDGKIAVHFHETEAEHGVLYVANGGRPLSESNFLRMASLGDSDKPIGVGIGNKGVGFKSVFQICDVPEVYSSSGPSDPGFSGFSFRFGTLSDLDHYLDPDDPVRTKLEAELSLSLLTVPLEAIPPTVADFRSQGFVTVLRLPASSSRAATEIRDRIDRLLASPSPIMLFLDRLESLSIQKSSETRPTLLKRRQVPDGDHTRVTLNETDDYRLFEGVVPHDHLLAALKDAVEEGALDERWLEWTAEASVSVAVGDGWAVPNPAPFTFLPMGEAAMSPLGGHINAPFVTDFARLGLDAEQPVNRLMLRRVAEVCVHAAESLIAAKQDAGAVVDLLAWNPDSLEWITDAVKRVRNVSLDEFVRLPSIGGTDWPSLSKVSAWPETSCEIVTVDRVVRAANARLIDTSRVDARRLDRLAHAKAGAGSLAPSPTLTADWVESVAESLVREGASLGQWRAFYDDLPTLFSIGAPLYGKRILLAESGELVPADQPVATTGNPRTENRRQRAVFFAPKAAGTEDDDAVDSDVDISPPRSLARRIVFLHRDLDWYVGPQQTPGRKFLQDHRLARQFRTASLLTHLGQLMSANPSDAVKRDGLDFAFRLFATNPTKHSKELAGVGLTVPTAAAGWVKASAAHFSKGWEVPGADDLSDLVAGAPNPSSELAQIANRLIAEPALVGGTTPNLAKWAAFLRVLGVAATLPINQVRDGRRMYGQNLNAEVIAGDGAPAGLPAGVIEQWHDGITSTGNAHHPETYFTTSDPVYWFAGQHEVAKLSARLRSAYARLVMRTTPSLTEAHKRSTWSRDRAGGWPTFVETPLWSFLTLADWVPVAVPNETAREFRTPAQSWYVGVEDTMAAAYSPLVDSRLRTLMDSAEIGERRWRQLDFLSWTDPEDAASLVDHLTELFTSGDIPETASEHFRTSLATAWAAVGDPGIETHPALDNVLLVESSGQLSLASKEESSNGRLFVTGTHDQSATARLVRELGWPVVAVESSDSARLNEVAKVLRTFWQDDVQVTLSWQLEVLSDGIPWKASQASPRLTDEVPWVPLLIAACMRFPRASGMRVGRQLGRALDDLAHVRLVSANRVAIASAGGDQALPARLHGVLPMTGDIPSLLAEAHQNPPTWEQFEVLAQALLELLGQERFKAEVSLTIRDLSTEPDQPISRPTNAELAEVLRAPEEQITELESAVFGAVAGIVARLRHVTPVFWGDAALEPFSESLTAAYSRDDVRQVLAELCGDEAEANAILAAASDTWDANSLRLRLGVKLADFNAALARYFPSVALVDNGAAQAEEFDIRRRQRNSELVDWVRQARIERFDAGEIQTDWLELRDLAFLERDPDWATTMDEVSQHLLDVCVDEQMAARVGPRPAATHTLPDFEIVRTANGRALRERLTEAHRVVTAWCDRENAVTPAVWTAETFGGDLRQKLEGVGALDFRELSDSALATWLSRIGAWPTGMELSVVAAVHGLSHEDLHTQDKARFDAKAEKARAARRVKFQGVDVDLDMSMSALVDRVSRFLESNPRSLESAYRTSSLVEVRDGKGKGGGGGGTGGKNGGVITNHLSNEQTGAIGLAGEMVAFHWLKNRDPSGVVDASCWKSSNSRLVIEGVTGNDSLGYDFEVPRRGGSVMYEVKATTADAGMIELGETEVRCAQQFARSDRWRLLIVEDVLSTTPRLHMLPNPFRHESRSLFGFVGNSLRLRFRLK